MHTGRRIPALCLARCDSGDVPAYNGRNERLLRLTYIESMLLCRRKVLQQVLAVYRANCPPDARPLAYKTHGVAVSAPGSEPLEQYLPIPARDMPETVTVAVMNQVLDRADMERRLASVKPLKVRGANLAAWVHHLQDVNAGVSVDDATLQQYEGSPLYGQPGGAVPTALLEQAVATPRADVAAVLQATFLNDRAGNAAVRQGEDELMAAQRAQRQGGERPQPPAEQQNMGGAGTVPYVGLAAQPRAANDGASPEGEEETPSLEELELVIPQAPPPAQPGSADGDRSVAAVREQLGRKMIVHCAGGPGAAILREDDPRDLAESFPGSMPFPWGGQRPVQVSTTLFHRHIAAKVPREQFSGNPHLMVRMADMEVKREVRASTAITARVAPQVVEQAGTLPREFTRQLAEVLSLRVNDPRRQRVMSQAHDALRSFVTGVEKVVGRVDMTDAYYRNVQQELRCANLQLGLPMLFWNINPADMHSGAVVLASGQVGVRHRRVQPHTCLTLRPHESALHAYAKHRCICYVHST